MFEFLYIICIMVSVACLFVWTISGFVMEFLILSILFAVFIIIFVKLNSMDRQIKMLQDMLENPKNEEKDE